SPNLYRLMLEAGGRGASDAGRARDAQLDLGSRQPHAVDEDPDARGVTAADEFREDDDASRLLGIGQTHVTDLRHRRRRRERRYRQGECRYQQQPPFELKLHDAFLLSTPCSGRYSLASAMPG